MLHIAKAMYKFSSQQEGVDFLRELGFIVGRHGTFNHIYSAESPGLERDIAFVAQNGEMCRVDDDKPELKKYHDIIESTVRGL